MNSVQRNKFSIFKNSCRVYEKEQECNNKLLFLYPDLKSMVQINEEGEIKEMVPVFLIDYSVNPLILKEYELVIYDIWFVDHYMSLIDKIYGREAKEICFKLFVKQQTQESCASDHSMTRDQLQYRVDKWLTQIFGGD